MSFSVKVEPSGHTFTVEPNESILDAALRQGVVLPYGCRSGACGSCVAKIIAGRIHYPDGELPPSVSAEEAAVGMAALCLAQADSDLVIESKEVESPTEITVKTFPCRIEVMQRLNEDVMLLKLKLPDAERMQFLAGQYIHILLKDGRKRSFSLANAPEKDDLLELHIRHVEGGEFTTEVFDKMKVGDILRIEGPHGQFYLREDSPRDILFMAGGTGFAPIKGMIEHAIDIGLERTMTLYWGARTRENLYLHDWCERMAAEHANFNYVPVLSAPTAEDRWTGRTVLVHEAIIADHPDLSGFDIYAAGPPAMVEAGKEAFPQHGLDLEHYYSDAFEFQSK